MNSEEKWLIVGNIGWAIFMALALVWAAFGCAPTYTGRSMPPVQYEPGHYPAHNTGHAQSEVIYDILTQPHKGRGEKK